MCDVESPKPGELASVLQDASSLANRFNVLSGPPPDTAISRRFSRISFLESTVVYNLRLTTSSYVICKAKPSRPINLIRTHA